MPAHQTPVVLTAERALARFARTDAPTVGVDMAGLLRHSVFGVVERVRAAGVFCYALTGPRGATFDVHAAPSGNTDFTLYMERTAPQNFTAVAPLATRELCDALVLENAPAAVLMMPRPLSVVDDVLPLWFCVSTATVVLLHLLRRVLGESAFSALMQRLYAAVDTLPFAASVYNTAAVVGVGGAFLALVGFSAAAAGVSPRLVPRDLSVRDPCVDAWAASVLARHQTVDHS